MVAQCVYIVYKIPAELILCIYTRACECVLLFWGHMTAYLLVDPSFGEVGGQLQSFLGHVVKSSGREKTQTNLR